MLFVFKFFFCSVILNKGFLNNVLCIHLIFQPYIAYPIYRIDLPCIKLRKSGFILRHGNAPYRLHLGNFFRSASRFSVLRCFAAHAVFLPFIIQHKHK